MRCKNLCKEEGKKTAHMYQYEHVRRRSKPRNNMDNQWKRHMTIEEMTGLCLVGGGLKHGKLFVTN